MFSSYYKVENILKNREIAVSQYYLIFLTMFPKATYLRVVTNWDYVAVIEPFPKQQNLDSSKLKEFADDNFGFDENGRELSKWVENTGKRRNWYKQFLLFPLCFQKTCTADT